MDRRHPDEQGDAGSRSDLPGNPAPRFIRGIRAEIRSERDVAIATGRVAGRWRRILLLQPDRRWLRQADWRAVRLRGWSCRREPDWRWSRYGRRDHRRHDHRRRCGDDDRSVCRGGHIDRIALRRGDLHGRRRRHKHGWIERGGAIRWHQPGTLRPGGSRRLRWRWRRGCRSCGSGGSEAILFRSCGLVLFAALVRSGGLVFVDAGLCRELLLATVLFTLLVLAAFLLAALLFAPFGGGPFFLAAFRLGALARDPILLLPLGFEALF